MRSKVRHGAEEALLPAADLPQGSFPGLGFQFEDLAGEGQEGQLDIIVLVIDHHELMFEIEPPRDPVRMPTGQLFLVELPELPLAQGVT